MQQLPMMIYRGGKLNANPANYRIVNDVPEILVAATEGFWTHKVDSAEAVKKLDYVQAYFAKQKEEINKQKLVETIIERAANVEEVEKELPSLEERFKDSTGANAIIDRGPYKGQETKQFKIWKENHNA